MRIEKFRGVPLLITLILVLLLSSYVQLHHIQRIIPQYEVFLANFKDNLENLNLLIFIISFFFQAIIMFASIGMEVLLLYVIVYFFYKKMHYLKEFTHPVIMSTLAILMFNICFSLLFLPKISDTETLKSIALFSPANYLIKPLIVCYLLYKKDIVSKKLSDWIKVGVVYTLFICIPGVLLLIFGSGGKFYG